MQPRAAQKFLQAEEQFLEGKRRGLTWMQPRMDQLWMKARIAPLSSDLDWTWVDFISPQVQPRKKPGAPPSARRCFLRLGWVPQILKTRQHFCCAQTGAQGAAPRPAG